MTELGVPDRTLLVTQFAIRAKIEHGLGAAEVGLFNLGSFESARALNRIQRDFRIYMELVFGLVCEPVAGTEALLRHLIHEFIMEPAWAVSSVSGTQLL